MDHLQRLIAGLLLAFGLCAGSFAAGSVAVIGTGAASWSGTGACAGLNNNYAGITTLKQAADTCANYLSTVVGGGGVHWIGSDGCGTTGRAVLFKQYNWGGFAVGVGATPADGWVNGECGWTEPAKSGQTAGWDNTYTLTNSGGSGVPSCPANATGTGSPITACTCNVGYAPNGGATACVALTPPVCAAKDLGDTQLGPFTSLASAWLTWQMCESVPATDTTTAGGCLHTFDTFVTIEGAAGFYATMREKTTGANCTPNGGGLVPVEGSGGTPPPAPTPASSPSPSTPAPTPTQNTCGFGNGPALCPGGVNGAIVCVPCGSTSSGGGASTPAPKPVAGASAPSGGSGGAGGTGGTVPTPDGGTVSIPIGGDALQGTTCVGGVCTTKTIIRTSTGTVDNVVTTTQVQTDFCAKNPGNSICASQNTGSNGKPGTGSGSGSGSGSGNGEGEAAPTFGGTCGAGFTCTGDAVQCAMARDQMLRNCKNFDDAASNDPVVVAAAAGASSPAGHPINSGTSKSLTFDQTNIMSGSCPADVSVTVSHFNAVNLPFSALCTPATWLGNILVGITALSCLGIVFVRGS